MVVVKLLALAACENEAAVDAVLQQMLDQEVPIEVPQVAQLVQEALVPESSPEVQIAPVDLRSYDALLMTGKEVV